jgi:carbon-monoxide dehydrogenase medium subunit
MLQKLPPFDYYLPDSVEEAVEVLDRRDGNVAVLAGGTDLLVRMKEGMEARRLLLDIKKISALKTIGSTNGALCFGAAVSTRTIARLPLVRERFPVLAQALQQLGSVQIGNRATIGGNLCNASPAADSAPPLLALGASVKLMGPNGERELPLEKFFEGPGKTVLQRELLTEVHVPAAPAQGRGLFYKLGLRAAPEDICVVSVAVFAVPDVSRQRWADVRIALGAVAPTPVRARHAEAVLRDEALEGAALQEAARLAADKDASPISDIRGSASYRRAMVRELVARALAQLAREMRGEPKR